MAKIRAKLSPVRLVLALLALVMIAVSWRQVLAASSGLVVRQVDQAGVPLQPARSALPV